VGARRGRRRRRREWGVVSVAEGMNGEERGELIV